jgi:hypothetical protein
MALSFYLIHRYMACVVETVSLNNLKVNNPEDYRQKTGKPGRKT